MKFARLFFGLKNIYFKQTSEQIFYFYFFIGAVGGSIMLLAFNDTSGSFNPPIYIIWPLFAVFVYFLLRTILRTWIVDKYIRQYPESIFTVSPAEVYNSSINLELDKVDRVKPIQNFGKGNLFIATFDFYRSSKYGDYLAKQAYYTVLELPLDRMLPHILFDSKSAKRRQFKNLYLKAQQLSMQGTFDQIFDTYVPQTYNIDSLSFVTPEVMEALVDAKMYDIEIVNNRLLLYAPLLDDDDLKPFVGHGKKIAKELNDNIDTYRDDRLTGDKRVTEVTTFAKTLLQSPSKYLFIASIAGALTIDIIYWAITAAPSSRQGILLNQISLLVYITLMSHAWKAIKIMRKNKDAEERFRVLCHTDRGKPIKHK
jgi:hypothetical protein